MKYVARLLLHRMLLSQLRISHLYKFPKKIQTRAEWTSQYNAIHVPSILDISVQTSKKLHCSQESGKRSSESIYAPAGNSTTDQQQSPSPFNRNKPSSTRPFSPPCLHFPDSPYKTDNRTALKAPTYLMNLSKQTNLQIEPPHTPLHPSDQTQIQSVTFNAPDSRPWWQSISRQRRNRTNRNAEGTDRSARSRVLLGSRG